MKDLFFATDLLEIFRHDKYYGVHKNLSVALRKFGLQSIGHSDSIEHMSHALVVHIMDQCGESEPFLSETFIYPAAVVGFFKAHGLSSPADLLPATPTSNSKAAIDLEQIEQYFDTVCRNCGTVTDPLASSYRTPIGRLIFRTFLETRQSLGINATGRYVLEHLEVYDSDKIITSVNEDSVTWLTEDSKEKLTSVQTIASFVLNFNREVENLL